MDQNGISIFNQIISQMSSTGVNKQVIKIGQMVIDQKQIFWKMQHCYALIPIVQLEDGHVLIATYRNVSSYTQLKPVQVFDLSLAISFVCKAIESYYGCTSSNIHIQNSEKQGERKMNMQADNEDFQKLDQMIVHIIPRKSADPKVTESIYQRFQQYPKSLVKHYNQKMNFYVNAYANKILEGIHEQSKKYQTHFSMCFKEEKEN